MQNREKVKDVRIHWPRPNDTVLQQREETIPLIRFLRTTPATILYLYWRIPEKPDDKPDHVFPVDAFIEGLQKGRWSQYDQETTVKTTPVVRFDRKFYQLSTEWFIELTDS